MDGVVAQGCAKAKANANANAKAKAKARKTKGQRSNQQPHTGRHLKIQGTKKACGFHRLFSMSKAGLLPSVRSLCDGVRQILKSSCGLCGGEKKGHDVHFSSPCVSGIRACCVVYDSKVGTCVSSLYSVTSLKRDGKNNSFYPPHKPFLRFSKNHCAGNLSFTNIPRQNIALI